MEDSNPTTPLRPSPRGYQTTACESPRPPYFRSNSSDSNPLSAPPMVRAHSLPTVIGASSSGTNGTGGFRSLSPSPVPVARPSSPLRFSGAPRVCDISEDAELDLTPRAGLAQPPLGSLHSSSNSLGRAARRRPASPLHHVAIPGTPTSAPTISSSSPSPLLSPAKFNEPFPGVNSHYPSSLASSSMPSTPTSMRSRSPSISSLETIPDTPDAEEQALEDERIARLKAAADGEDGRRSSLDVPSERRALGFGKRDSRKRWSVCGAERRGDLDLETIWED